MRRRQCLPLYVSALVLILALPLLGCLIHPASSLAQQGVGEVDFVLIEQDEAYEGHVPAAFYDKDEVNIRAYKDGRAEAHYSDGENRYDFTGTYSSSRKQLSGTLEWVTKGTLVTATAYELRETFKGKLDARFVDENRMEGVVTGYLTSLLVYTDKGEISQDNSGDREWEYVAYRDPPIGSDSTETTISPDSTETTISPGSTETTISPGGDGEQSPETGNKIPGPGSWWEWLTGTVVAGAVAAGVGLVGALFGATPPSTSDPGIEPTTPDAPPSPEAPRIGLAESFHEIPPDQGRDIAGGPVRLPSDMELFGTPPVESVLDQTIMNIFDDLRTVPGDLFDKAKWVFDGVTNVDNLKGAADKVEKLTEQLDGWKEQKAKDAVDYIQDAARDPSKPFKDLEEAQKSAAKSVAENLLIPILQDPFAALKSLLGVEFWEKAMDWRLPLVDRFGNSVIATLNTIALIEGASGLKGWFLGGAEKKAAAEALIGSQAKDKLPGATGAALKGEEAVTKAGTAKIPKVKPAPGFFDEVSAAEKAKLKTIWSNDAKKTESRIKAFKDAMKPDGDLESRTKAILEIQRDPLAIRKLNLEDKRVIKSFNKRLAEIRNEALEDTRRLIAEREGVGLEQVEVFKATNPKAPGAKIKAGMDQDLTVRIREADGTLRDVPAKKLQGIYDDSFYKAAGSPEGTTAAQLGKDCRNVAVDQHSAEAFGMAPDDWKEMQLGKGTASTDTVARTMEYKSNEAFARADELAKSGNKSAALKERYLGQRETVKAFNNQIKTRAEYIGRVAPEKMAEVKVKIAGVEGTIKKMDEMIAKGSSPVQIDDFLRSQNTTAEDVSKQVADIYRGLTP